MTQKNFVDTAKVMAKGQVTIPRDVRKVLGVGPGSRVSFIVEDGSVRIVNAFKYALQEFQKDMEGEGAKLGLDSEEAVVDAIMKMRKGEDF